MLGRHFVEWGGGCDLLRILATALVVDDNDVWLLIPVRAKRNDRSVLSRIRGVGRNVAKMLFGTDDAELPSDRAVVDFFSDIPGRFHVIRFEDSPVGLLACLRKIEAQVILPAAESLGELFPVPWVGYIYDFQHKYYPNLFSSRECLSRDIAFAQLLRDAKAVIVYAKAVVNDIDTYYPYHKCRVFDLPYAAAPLRSWLEDCSIDPREKYNLPARYFIICNQFWVHKSHMTAFEALAQVIRHDAFKDVHIVCTGRLEDHRCPAYVEDMKLKINAMGMADRIHLLGLIPKFDQISMLKKAVAVVQPTLFEGGPGGGAVFDAVSCGIPAIVSDIPVNLELHEDGVEFFKVGSADDLARKMLQILKDHRPRPSHEVLIEMGKRRNRLLSEKLMEAISFASGKHD